VAPNQQVNIRFFLCGNGNENHELGTVFLLLLLLLLLLFVHKRTNPAVKRIESVSDWMSHTILGGRWCDIIVLNVHASTEDKTDDMKDSFYEEVESVFDKFPKYRTKILLGDFNDKIGRENIFKPTLWNDSLHEFSNDNGVKVLNFATSKNLSKVQCS
jgi:hypothetical protein